MGSAERRERERETLRLRIVEAARDILSEEGLEGLSMRAIAERIEYSPATIYLYFKDKDDLIRSVVEEAFLVMAEYMKRALAEVGRSATPGVVYRATGRAYVRFALENTAYFRVMFELPGVPQCDCPEPGDGVVPEDHSFETVVQVIQRAIDAGEYVAQDAQRGATIGWALLHGLTSLYLSGHLRDVVSSSEEFLALVEEAMDQLRVGWLPRSVAPHRVTGSDTGSRSVNGEARPGAPTAPKETRAGARA